MATARLRQTGYLTGRLLPSVLGSQQAAPLVSSASSGRGKEQGGQGGPSWGAAIGLGLLGAGVSFAAPLLAEDNEKTIRGRSIADRVRQYASSDHVFGHFAGYQLISETGKKTTLMSTRNFYHAMTPGSHLNKDDEVGRSAYKKIEISEIESAVLKNAEKLPNQGGNLLNNINEHGLLTYTDYHFLLLLISTPSRYLDILFHGFDISADGKVEAKEFVHVLARIANAKLDPNELMREGNMSGLVKYLFKDDLSGVLDKEDFVKLHDDLITDVLAMEFTRYVSDTSQLITETDFCRHLLYSSNIPQKKKDKMIKMVSDEFKGSSAKGISFESFKSFYSVLFGGSDLERAMFFLDEEKKGVTQDGFSRVANWVIGAEIDPHVIEVIYCLLDEDGDRYLSSMEFNPVLFNWRHSRGFHKGGVNINLGHMKF